MLTHVEFSSAQFPPLPNEEQLVNPGLWGKRLADFLRDGLRSEGYDPGEPIPEDWGWMVPVCEKPFRLWIGCGSYQDEQRPNRFLCFIEPHKPFVRRLFRRIETRESLAQLQHAIDLILSTPEGITEKRWWSFEEFNGRYNQP